MSAWEKNMEKEIAELKKGLNLRIDTQHDSDMRSLDIIGINELDIRHIKSVLTEWIDWTLESFNAGVNDEYLEKLKQIKKKLSAKDEQPPEPFPNRKVSDSDVQKLSKTQHERHDHDGEKRSIVDLEEEARSK